MADNFLRIAIVEDERDRLEHTLTILKEVNGQFVFHRKVDRSKIIDGDDFVVDGDSDL